MEPGRLMERACERTGLEDFGGDGFREGLEVLCRALEQEAELHDTGREVAAQHLLRLLANRLRIEAWLAAHPEIEEQAVPEPIFVLGLPRTGTTALSALLARDPDTRSVRTWESSDPIPPPEAATQHDDPRIARTEAGLAAMHEAFPEAKKMHDAEATGPTECQDLLGLEFKAQHFAGQYHVPSYESWLLGCDMVPAYRTHRRVLQLLQWHCPPTRWHLKTPVHMLSLPELVTVYPDARFVMTHRDPARVLGSVCSLIQLMYRIASDWNDAKALGREQLELWAKAMERAMAFRDAQPAQRFVDLPFREQLADPVAAVERCYADLGLPMTPEARRRMDAWAAEHRRGRHGEHRYRLSDFGLEPDAVRARFAAYMERFDVPREETE